MAVTLAQMRAGFVTSLKAKLGDDDQQISGYVLKNPNPPVLWVRLQPNQPIEYHQAMGPATTALAKWLFFIEAFVGDITDKGAQMRTDKFIQPGAQCVFEALEADKTLGGVVQNLIVPRCDAYVEFQRANGAVAVGARWHVEVYP